MNNFCYLKLAGDKVGNCKRNFGGPFCERCAWNAEEDARRRLDINRHGLKSKYSLWKMKDK